MVRRRTVCGCLLVVFSLVLLSTAVGVVRAQSGDYCQEPVDQPFLGCLREVAKYTSWMVTPAKVNLPGELQQAVDGVYKTMQEEWTGPTRSHTHVKWLFLLVPLFFFLYVACVTLFASRFPPIYQATGPRWNAEKYAIIFGAVAFSVLLLGERFWAYGRMTAEYEIVPRIVTHLLHLRQPAELIRATNNPCEVVYAKDDLLLSFCPEDWANNARVARSALIHSAFTKRLCARI